MTRALELAAEAGADGARSKAPRGETLDLVESIGWDSEPGRAVFYFDDDAGLPMEYGNAVVDAQPFMRPAMDDAARAID